MKKGLALLLCAVLMFGMAGTAFAANPKITGAIQPIDYNYSPDLYGSKADTSVKFPLTANMFSWSEEKTGGKNEAVTSAQLSAGKIALKYRIIKGDKLISSIELKNNGSFTVGGSSIKTSYVQVTFVETYTSTKEEEFEILLYFTHDKTRQTDSDVTLYGSLANANQVIDSDTDYLDISEGRVLEPTEYISSIDLYLGEGVTLEGVKLYSSQKYYGVAKDGRTASEDDILTKYSSIEEIIVLTTTNLKKNGKYVKIDRDTNYYVYDASRKYIGRTDDLLPYSDKYYLSSKSIDMGGGTAASSSSSMASASTPPASTSGDAISAATATQRVQEALQASGNKSTSVRFTDAESITGEALQAMAKTASGVGATVVMYADTTSGSAVTGRVTIYPARATSSTANIQLGAYVDDAHTSGTKAFFEKWFSNKVATVSLAQKGSYGFTVEVAVKKGMGDIPTNNLYFYSYNQAKNEYTRILNTSYYMDANGYLHFNTVLGGEIVICDGPLKAK